MNLADHICELPGERDRKRWWTCPECGQLWRHDGTPGAVLETYADTYALDVDCTGPNSCGASAGEFCRWPNGRERKTPCGSRKARAAAVLARHPVNLDRDAQ